MKNKSKKIFVKSLSNKFPTKDITLDDQKDKLKLSTSKKNIIGSTIHFEEGARFWQKPNKNLLINISLSDQKKIKNKNFVWLNLSQIKKLNLINGIINPFVKTILFII